MSDRDYALGELDRRLANIFRIGTVAAVDGPLATVDLGDLVTDWLPFRATRAGQDVSWSSLDVGEQVVVLSPGDPSQGVIVCSLYSNAHPANGSDVKTLRTTFKDGTVMEFDRDTSALNVNVNPAGSITLHVGGTTLKLENGKTTLTTPELVVNSPQSKFTGTVRVEGLLTYVAGMAGSGGGGASANINGSINVTGGNVTADGIGLKTHHHTEHDGPSTSAALA